MLAQLLIVPPLSGLNFRMKEYVLTSGTALPAVQNLSTSGWLANTTECLLVALDAASGAVRWSAQVATAAIRLIN